MKKQLKVALMSATGILALAGAVQAGPISGFSQTNLVSNIPGLAANTDPNLTNAWGISMSSGSPFWVSDNAAGKATLYNSVGTPQALVVTIPGVGGNPGTPTGTVFSGIAGSFNADTFLFVTEDGLIAGWRGALGTTAEVLANNSGANAVYKGMSVATIGANSYVYAADFHNNQITVLPGTGAPALTGNFTDPNLPAGYAPFNIQKLNGQLYVTYALQDAAKHDEVDGAGKGFVDVYDLNGNLLSRVASQGALNAPWGLALAPSGFGTIGGDLLVGNFGDGSVNIFTPAGAFVGTLADGSSNPIVNDGLWGLTFGNGGNGGSTGSLYLTAGLNGEADGLFARIDAVPEPGVIAFAGIAMLGLRRRRTAPNNI